MSEQTKTEQQVMVLKFIIEPGEYTGLRQNQTNVPPESTGKQ